MPPPLAMDAGGGGWETLVPESPIAIFDKRTSLPSYSLSRTKSVGNALTAAEREELGRKYGAENVDSMEEEAKEVFASIDNVADGALDLKEFASALGTLGARAGTDEGGLASFMFRAVDRDNSGTIAFKEFLEWTLRMTCGSREEKLRFGFDICDFNHDGTIDRAELTRLIQSMMQVLSGLSLDSHSKDIDYFVDELFGFDTDADAGLSWEEYREACDAMGDRMAHLGAHTKLTRSESAGRVAGARKSHAMKSMGSRLFFGQERWEFMLTLMLGLQIAVEDSKEELDRAAQVSPTPWPLADDLSRWAAF